MSKFIIHIDVMKTDAVNPTESAWATVVDTTLGPCAGEAAVQTKELIKALLDQFIRSPEAKPTAPPPEAPTHQEQPKGTMVAHLPPFETVEDEGGSEAPPPASQAEGGDSSVRDDQDDHPAPRPYYITPHDDQPGLMGPLQLHCGQCGDTFFIWAKEPVSKVACRCGHTIELGEDLAKFRYSCPCCGRKRTGHTNIVDASFETKCGCGNPIVLNWDKRHEEYRD